MRSVNLLSIEQEETACRAAWKGAKAKVAWHLHHEVLCELLTEPAENRIAYILSDKPKEEQALRLRLFRPVRGKLPAALDKAGAAYGKAGAAYAKAGAAYAKAGAALDKAGAAYGKAEAAAAPAMERLHAKECAGCPWTGRSIFG